MKMWSGRFRKPLNPRFEQWQRSLPFDRRLLPQEVRASAAHARALGRAGVLKEDEVTRLVAGLQTIQLEAERDPRYLNEPHAEDVHHFVELKLIDLAGELGFKLHSGRSRNEQIATDLRLYARDSIDALRERSAELLDAWIEQAKKAGEAAMPSYTHQQAAEPVLVAHWLLAYTQMLLRDCERLAECRVRLNKCPLGSGAIAGSTLALDRAAIAKELGFDAPTANSMDATSDRDFAIESVQAFSLMMVHLSRWAEEMVLFATREYGFVRLPESYSTGSSAMPQKQNPDSMELVRGKSARVLGAATTLTAAMSGRPLAYNKDMQETQEPLFDAAETALACVEITAGFVREVEFDFPRLQAAAESGHMNSFAAATYLVRKGVPFRLAHEKIGNAVRRCLEKGCGLAELPLEELKEFAPEIGEDFYAAVSLAAVLGCHDVAGGTHPARVKELLRATEEQVARLRKEVHAHT